MKRKTHPQPIHQCQAITKKKNRCSRAAVVMHKNRGYCELHYGILLGNTLEQGEKYVGG